MPAVCGAFSALYRIFIPLLFAAVTFVGFAGHSSLLLLGFSIPAGACAILRLLNCQKINLSFSDVAVLIFGGQILLSGFLGVGGAESAFRAVLSFSFLAVAFCISLSADDKDRECAVSAIVAASAVSAVVGVWQIFKGGYESGWLDSAVFSGISVRVTSLFGNPNVYSAYLLLVIPFVFFRAVGAVVLKKKLLYFVLLALLVLCMVQTWSRGAWLGLALEFLVCVAFYRRRLVPYALLSLPAFAVTVSALSSDIRTRLLSIGDLSDTSVSYRISAWKGILRMLFDNKFFGIGYGESDFLAVYPLYAESGATAVRHSHSLYLQILTELGAGGLAVFCALIIAAGFNIIRKQKQNGVSMAGTAAVLGVLLMGWADHIWYDQRIFCLFWLVIGLMRGKGSVDDSQI